MAMIFSRANERRQDVGAEHVENYFSTRKADIRSHIEAGKFVEAVLSFSSLAEAEKKALRSKNANQWNAVLELARTIVTAIKAKITDQDTENIALSLLRLNQILEDLPNTEIARADILDAVGSAYLSSEGFSAAVGYLERAVTLIELTNSPLESKVQIYWHLFTAYYRLGELKQAVRYGEQGVTYAEQLETEEVRTTLADLYSGLAHCEEALHRMQRARKWVLKVTQLRSQYSDLSKTTRTRCVSQSPNNSPQSSPDQPSAIRSRKTMRMTCFKDFSQYLESRDSGNASSDATVSREVGLKTVSWAQDLKGSSDTNVRPGKSPTNSPGKTQSGSLPVNSRPREFTFGMKETIGTDTNPSSSVLLTEPRTAGIHNCPGTNIEGFKRRISLRLVNSVTDFRSIVPEAPVLHQCWKRTENGLFVLMRITMTQSNHWTITVSGSDKKILTEESVSPKNVYRRMTPSEFASIADIDSAGKVSVPKTWNQGAVPCAQIELFRTKAVFEGLDYDLRFSIDQKLTVLLIEAKTSGSSLKKTVLNDIDLKSREELTRFVEDLLLPRIVIQGGKIEILLGVGENSAESSFQRAAHLQDKTYITTFSEAAKSVSTTQSTSIPSTENSSVQKSKKKPPKSPVCSPKNAYRL